MHFADKFVMAKKSEVARTKSSNELSAQGRRIPQLAVSQCIDLSTAASISANCFYCSCRCYASAASGSNRSITLTLFFSAFIGIVFFRHHKIMKVFYALNLKVFPKYLLLMK